MLAFPSFRLAKVVLLITRLRAKLAFIAVMLSG
jgi:hypothetical protein